MRTASILLVGLMLTSCISFAQKNKNENRISKKETVIINGNNSGTTTIEINRSGVYLNGELLGSCEELNRRNIDKEIVIRSAPERYGSYEEYRNGEQSPSRKRALLGVFTDVGRTRDGATIDRVSPGSAAEKAGLRAGDLIIRIDSNDVSNAGDLTRVVRGYYGGDEVTVVYKRNGKQRQTTATLGEAPEDRWSEIYERPDLIIDQIPPFGGAFPLNMDSDENKRPRLGVTVENENNSVVVRRVKSNSPAEAADIREGDKITYVNDSKLGSVAQLQELIGDAKIGGKLKVEINRSGARLTKMVEFTAPRDRTDL